MPHFWGTKLDRKVLFRLQLDHHLRLVALKSEMAHSRAQEEENKNGFSRLRSPATNPEEKVDQMPRSGNKRRRWMTRAGQGGPVQANLEYVTWLSLSDIFIIAFFISMVFWGFGVTLAT